MGGGVLETASLRNGYEGVESEKVDPHAKLQKDQLGLPAHSAVPHIYELYSAIPKNKTFAELIRMLNFPE
jgi:hypothetical protein